MNLKGEVSRFLNKYSGMVLCKIVEEAVTDFLYFGKSFFRKVCLARKKMPTNKLKGN